MSDSSRTQMRYLEESSWGVIPASAMTNLRITGEDLSQNANYVVSSEIEASAQNSDVVRTKIEPGGTVNFELSYGNLDALLAGALRNAWSTSVNISAATDIAAVASGNKYTSTSTDFTTKNLVVGQWIKVSGFATAANNGYALVVSFDATNLVVAGLTLVNESATPAITMSGSHLVNGTTKKSFVLEKEFTDITQFLSFTGMRVGGFSLDIRPGSIITGSMNFMGKAAARAGATVGTGSANAAPTNAVMNAVDNVSLMKEGGSAITLDVTQITLSLNNALRPLNAVGSLSNVQIGQGTIEVTGSLNTYFASGALYDKFLADTPSSLSFLLSDAAGNAYMMSLQQLKFTDSKIVAGGKDQDVIANTTFTAYKDPVYGSTLSIGRFPAA